LLSSAELWTAATAEKLFAFPAARDTYPMLQAPPFHLKH